jgi:hypothetical protein
MPYFLDGNNLIGIARRTSRPGEDDRSSLIAEIAARLRTTRASVRLFFDGGPSRAISLGNLSVSGRGGSADDAILQELTAAKDPGQITVVTADRDLARRTRDAGGKTMSPGDFWSRFGTSESGATAKGDRVDVDEWLDYFSRPENRDE